MTGGPRILISYRPGDADGSAARLHDRAVERFGGDRVVMAGKTLDFGETVSGAAARAVEACDVVLVVIGPGWLASADRAGRRRLENPDDRVRAVVAAALKRGVRLVPVLVDGADAPLRAELPEPIGDLADRHACELLDDTFDADADDLLDRVERLPVQARSPAPQQPAPAVPPRPAPPSPAPGPRPSASDPDAAAQRPPAMLRRDLMLVLRVVALVAAARLYDRLPTPYWLLDQLDLYPDTVSSVMLQMGACFALVVLLWHLRSARQLLHWRPPVFLAAAVGAALLAAATSGDEFWGTWSAMTVYALYLPLAHKLALGGRWSRIVAAALGAFVLYFGLGTFTDTLYYQTADLLMERKTIELAWLAGYVLGMYGPLGWLFDRFFSWIRPPGRSSPSTPAPANP